MNIKDIADKDKNNKMSHKDFSETLKATVASIRGNIISLNFKRMGQYEIAANHYAECWCKINGGDYKIVNNPYYLSIPGLPIPKLNITLLETPANIKAGDDVTLEWDISKLPASWWADGKYIVRSNMSGKLFGATDIPSNHGNVFVQCNINNQELPTGVSISDGDGIVSCNIHHREENDREQWIVEKVSGTYKTIRLFDESIHIAEKLSTAVEDIPVTKLSKPITMLAEEARKYAEENNLAEYVVFGKTITNDKYNTKAVK